MTITGPLADTVNNKNPGPGAYEPMKKMTKIGYSLRSKIKPPQPEAEKVPGPGACNTFITQTKKITSSIRQAQSLFPSIRTTKRLGLTREGRGSRKRKVKTQDPDDITLPLLSSLAWGNILSRTCRARR